MKNILIAIMLLASIKSNAQCIGGVCYGPGEGAKITAAFIVDNSFKFYQPSGFAGIGIHAGVWVGSLGFTIGGIDSKKNTQSNARRDLAFSMMTRVRFLNEKIQAVPFFSVGTNNYQDVGLRLGYKIGRGTYLGAMSSINLHYGLSLTVSVESNN